jgi:hypothetical protein
VLKNAAPDFFRQQPKLGDHFRAEMHERLVAGALAEPFYNPIEVTLLAVGKAQLGGHALAQDALEADFGSIFGQKIYLEIEEVRDGLVTPKAGQEQDVLAKWRGNCERSVRLCIRRHAVTPNSCP